MYFLQKFPTAKLTPKMHMLWKHVTDFMTFTGYGLGKYAEQGGEQLHKHINSITRRMQGVQKGKKEPEVTLLLSVMEEHIISTDPNIFTSFEE